MKTRRALNSHLPYRPVNLRRSLGFVAGWVGVSLLFPVAVFGQDGDFFETRIRPVLAEACYTCHGPNRSAGALRLDSKENFERGGKRGALVQSPGGESLLNAVLNNSATFAHPRVRIESASVNDFGKWIDGGALWPTADKPSISEPMADFIAAAKEEHWAFQPVFEPTVPRNANQDWARTPIDRFVLAKLEAAKLEPSPIADPYSLLRRITYDLTGLPPTYDDMQAFLKNPSREALEGTIDRLLASPQYGERWGRHWLDVARYSDTKGFGRAADRYFPFPHTYRDYVIRAFNEDLPYDEFVLQQLAADHLELGDDARPLAGMGFITLGRQFPGDRNATLDDQIDVVMRGFQGLTVSCARCHDHKFDPIPTADYYSLYGVFRSSDVPSELPLIEEPDTSSESYQAYKAELDKRQGAVTDYIKKLHVEQLSDARARVGEYLQAAYESLSTEDGKAIKELAQERSLTWQLVQRWVEHLKTVEERPDPVFGLWWKLARLSDFSNGAGEVVDAYLNATNAAENPIAGPIKTRFMESTPASMAEVNRHYGELLHEVDREWKDLLAAQTQIAAQQAEGTVTLPDALPDPERELVRLALYGPASPANFPQRDVEGLVNAELRRKIYERRTLVQEHISTHPARPDRAMALMDANQPYDPYVFLRGKEGTRGEDVPRRYLSVLAREERREFVDGSGRLELARAIANRNNPLTARVMVNRVWMHHFGQALVDTPSNFGMQGMEPTHPELLDHLAWEFMEDGWSLKRLHKRIMLSSVYLQSSETTSEAAAVDPENKLLWHYKRSRLDFESMRDSLLVAADNLDPAMGGHSYGITDMSFPVRRTVYAEVDRQELPNAFATFDFASPTSHSERRFETTVPQQSLYMMNNAFVAEQARSVARNSEASGDPAPQARIQALYRRLFQREATRRELELGMAFIRGMSDAPPLELAMPADRSDWRYGTGAVDEKTGRTIGFVEFPHWSGEAYQGDAAWPDGTLDWAQLGKLGGHPGEGEHAVIRRWTSPVDSTMSFIGELHHFSSLGDGIRAYIVSSREGIVWSGDVQDGMILSEFQGVPIQKGDTVDLVVFAKGEAKEDRFRWHPRLYLSGDDATQFPKQDWLTRFDFAGPQPKSPEPLGAWEQYAQVLLMSNEFMFVD